MTGDELKKIVGDAVSEALDVQKVSCCIGLDRESHDEEHRFLKKLMEISKRMDTLKWGFVGTIARGLGITMLLWMGWGFLEWLKIKVTGV